MVEYMKEGPDSLTSKLADIEASWPQQLAGTADIGWGSGRAAVAPRIRTVVSQNRRQEGRR